MLLNSKQICECTGGQYLARPIDPSALLSGVSWDSRDIQPGWLYVALPGERVDGHEFVEQALRKGALGALVTEAPDAACMTLARELGAAIIEVPNTAHALTDLASAWRGHLKCTVVGLTGSTGKTTTKNLLRDVLSARFDVVATRANQNNELGVPNTLLAAGPATEVVVVEMGMRGAGQIAELCGMVRPDVGVVTNVGESHIELLGSREAIARAKAELFEALPAGTGRAVVNGADPMSLVAAEGARLAERGVVTVAYDGSGQSGAEGSPEAAGLGASARVWAEDVSLDAEGRPSFTLCAVGFDEQPTGRTASQEALFDRIPERCACTVGLQGLHNVSNACAAAAVARSLGMPLADIADALARALPESGRLEVLRARNGATVVNDAYNANPDSMRASLAAFCARQVGGARYAVLGDMGELGSYAEACHRAVGGYAATCGIDWLVCVGELAGLIAEGARQGGFPGDRILSARTVADVLEILDARLEPDDAVLVKASHFMGLTRVVEGLVN